MKVNLSGNTSQLLQQLQSQASGNASVQLSLATSALKGSIENQELLLELLETIGKGQNLNVKA